MLLNEELESKISENKSSINTKKKKRKRKSKHYKYLTKKVYKYYNNDNDAKISLTEHNNILNEYEEELKFLNIKRKAAENIDKEKQNNNSSIIICVNNNKKDNNSNIFEDNYSYNEKKSFNNNNKNEKIKISQLYNLYHYLFVKSGLDCVSPSRFVDYLSNEISETKDNSLKKDKINFENIKKILLNLDKDNIENSLIDKLIKEYFHCTFKHSIFEKIIKKVNNIIINQNDNNNNLYLNNDNNSININNNIYDKNTKSKKDKYNYSNLLVEKLKNNNYKSSLSMSNDSELFKSIIYMNNKHSINNNNISEKTIINSLEAFKDKLNSFKKENKENVNKNNKEYLKNTLKSKKLRKYINNKLFSFNQSFNNNKILKILDDNIFNQIIKLLIDNKNGIKNIIKKINELKIPENINKNDVSNFLILLFFMAGITIINNDPNEISKSDLSILTPVFQYFNTIDKLSNIKINKKKKIKIKKINNKNANKIKIKIDDTNSEKSKIGNTQSYNEEKKLEDENNGEKEKEKIINIILNNNDNSLINQKISNNDNKSYKNDSSTNEIVSIKIPNSNKANNFQNSNNNNILIGKDIISEFKNENFEFNNFQKKLLNDLSLGKDIFKLDCVKIREKKTKNINDKKGEIYSEINIEIDEETEKINNEGNYIKNNDNNNTNGKIILKKDGNKIIIYNDEFSEGNKNNLK